MASAGGMLQRDGYVVIVNLQPRPLSSVGLDKRFTRIDYTSTCTMRDVLEGMSRVLKVDTSDLTLETEDGSCVALNKSLAEHYDKLSEPCPSLTAGMRNQWPSFFKRQGREINVTIRHTAPTGQGVTCVVGVSEDPDSPRITTVQLPNTATFSELLEQARIQRDSRLGEEGPVYGHSEELNISLRDAWVRNGCTVDDRLHVGRAVVVHYYPREDGDDISVVMGPNDTIGDVKKRICAMRGIGLSWQIVMIRGAVQGLENRVPLRDCCVRGVPVGGFAPEGWGELHLELRVKEPVFPLDAWLEGKPRGGMGATGEATRRFWNLSQQSMVARNLLAPHASVQAGTSDGNPQPWCLSSSLGADAAVSTMLNGGALAENVGGARQSPRTVCHRQAHNGACKIVVFALSPSGRALTLKVRQDANVSDAKEQIALDEGVPPCLQRLLWRGTALQPDDESLHDLGVRSGDTLILGYRIPRIAPSATHPTDAATSIDVYTPVQNQVADLRGNEGVVGRDGEAPPRWKPLVSNAAVCDLHSSPAEEDVVNNSSDGKNAPDDGGTTNDVGVGDGDAGGDSGVNAAHNIEESEKIPPARRAWPFSKGRGRGISDRGGTARAGEEEMSRASLSSPMLANLRQEGPTSAVQVHDMEGAPRTAGSGVLSVPLLGGSSNMTGTIRSYSRPSTPLGRVKIPGWARWKQARRVSSQGSSDGGRRGRQR